VDSGSSPPLVPGWLDEEKQAGFPWKRGRLLKSVRAASKSSKLGACKPDMFVGFNLEHTRCGFGSKVNNFMNQLTVAAYGNFSVSVAAFGELRDFLQTWNSFFENPLPFCESKKTVSDEQKFISRAERVFFHELAKTDAQYVENAKRAIYQAHYQYKAGTITHIQDTLKHYGLPEHYIGVEIRHGDKSLEAKPIETEEYAHVIQEGKVMQNVSVAVAMAKSAAEHIIAMKSTNIRTVWLATIDPDAETALRDALGAEYVIKSLVHYGHGKDWNGNADILYYPGSQHVYDLLTDVEALRRSHTFIATASSNIGRWVYFLREPGSKAISLDEHFLERAS